VSDPVIPQFNLHNVQDPPAPRRVRNGDPTTFIEQLSTNDPVTLFPASEPARWAGADVSQAILRVASVYATATPSRSKCPLRHAMRDHGGETDG
jgi:hypothetical protein